MFEQSAWVLQGLSVLLSRAAPVFASMTHFTISNKKDGKAPSVFKQREKEVCGTSPCRWERGMRNVKQMSWSSALPEMAELRLMLVHVSWQKGWRDNNLDVCLHLKVVQFWTYLHVCPCVCNLNIHAQLWVGLFFCAKYTSTYTSNTYSWVCIPARIP